MDKPVDPKPNELPSKAALRQSSIMALLGAVFVGVAVYLPAEHGVDPTGFGSLVGLTEMGEIKQQLAAEAEADEALHRAKAAALPGVWLDEVTFTLAPDQSTEIKATMEEGATLSYAWVASGGRINFNLHAHTDTEEVTYERGRGETSGEGSIEAPFAGNHGWFWRNRDEANVTITLKLNGAYSGIVQD